jgi:RecA-family ATPase
MQPENFGTLLSDIKSEQLDWLWEKRIPRRKLTVLDGDPGLGKSLLTLDLAARITTGRSMPDGTPGAQGSVVLIAPEDGVSDTIKPRIEAAGGDPSRIRLLNLVNGIDPRTRETSLSPFSLSKHFLTLVTLHLDCASSGFCLSSVRVSRRNGAWPLLDALT